VKEYKREDHEMKDYDDQQFMMKAQLIESHLEDIHGWTPSKPKHQWKRPMEKKPTSW
jgi:hypothetical protein